MSQNMVWQGLSKPIFYALYHAGITAWNLSTCRDSVRQKPIMAYTVVGEMRNLCLIKWRQESEDFSYLDRTLDLDATQEEYAGNIGGENFEKNAFDTENLNWDDEEFDL